ncbi:MAG: sigma-54-dependent Fis family transcriptional regulator [Candidatus Dactylopiibacterium carminicum]|nr:MAG: sigma-54-dependent Fis family transcriptional regulator [Candidatus Dactylopiibacterium carminicum]
MADERNKPVVLVTEDDENMRGLIAQVLKSLEVGVRIVCAESSQAALDYLERHPVAVVVTDLRMPGPDGLDVLGFARERGHGTQVVLLTGYATVESAVLALKNGAFDYLTKPFENEALRAVVERALHRHRLDRGDGATPPPAGDTGGQAFIGESAAVAGIRRLIGVAGQHDCNVLISGPSGSGKELVAQQIHRASNRAAAPFIAINCAAIPETLIESELFGYRKGAFTGADRNKPGLFEAAHGGTIFLDEISNASPSLQAKLLRVLQDRSFFAMGENRPREVDVRVVAATNRDMPALIGEGLFREDLYYRLMVMEIEIPPLKDRREDIPVLVRHFLQRFAERYGRPEPPRLTEEALDALMQYAWPGNVRELENRVQRMVIMTHDAVIDTGQLPPPLQAPGARQKSALDYFTPRSLDEIEAYFIRKTLRETNGDRALSAEILGIDKSTLWRKLKRYQLEA